MCRLPLVRMRINCDSQSFRYSYRMLYAPLCICLFCQSVARKIENSCAYKHGSLFLLLLLFPFKKKCRAKATLFFRLRSNGHINVRCTAYAAVHSFNLTFRRRSCSFCKAAACNKSFRKIFAESINQFLFVPLTAAS